VKIIIYDSRDIIPSDLKCDGVEISRCKTLDEAATTTKNLCEEKVIILNGSPNEEASHQFFKELKKANQNVIGLSVILFSSQKSSEVKSIFNLGVYDIFCGENIDEISMMNLVDSYKTSLDVAFFKKSISLDNSERTSVSRIIDFDLALEDPEEAGENSFSDELGGVEKGNQEIPKQDESEQSMSDDLADNEEKTAFKKLEGIIKKTIGFNKDNQEEIDLLEQKNQEIEEMFSSSVMEEEMDNEDNKKENELGEIEENANDLNLDLETETVHLNNSQDEVALDVSMVSDDEQAEMTGNDEDNFEQGVDIDLSDIGDLQLDGDLDTNLSMNEADQDDGIDLSLDSENDDNGMELDGGANELDLDSGLGDIDLSMELDGGTSLDDESALNADFDNSQIESDEISIDNVNEDGLNLSFSEENDIAPPSDENSELETELLMEDSDFTLDDNIEVNENDDGIDFSAAVEIDEGQEGVPTDSSDADLNLDVGDIDLQEPDAEIDISTSAESNDESSSDALNDDGNVFLGESDETGDIDIEAIKASSVEGQEIKSEESLGEEFDYKTGMIEQGALAAVNETHSSDQTEEDDFIAQGNKPEEILNEDNEGFSISSEVSKPANFDGDDLIQAKAMMETFKSQRDKLDDENSDLKKQLLASEKDRSKLKEELTEAKIETSIFKQKFEKLNHLKSGDDEGLKDQLRITEAKNRALKTQIENLKTNFIIDKQKISKREKDLESKIELMEVDIASQLKSREEKILELKRKIETLEFNMETTALQNQGLRENKKVLSERLRLVSESIRGAGRVLDESIDFEEMFDVDNHEDQAS